MSFANHAAFTELDHHFARLMERLAGKRNPALALAAALVSRQRNNGHSCLELGEAAGRFPDLETPPADKWIPALRTSRVVGRPGEYKPLILDERGRLYLQRFWKHETDLAWALRRRSTEFVPPLDGDQLRESLQRLFPAGPPEEVNWQKIAAFVAATRRLCLITGGPGTGKTHTIVALLAVLLEQCRERPLRIALAAPTGKAAGRLQESLKKVKLTLPCAEAVRSRLPEEAFTLHRLLGAGREPSGYRYDAKNLLPFEVVVVDEASMVDLELMAGLVAATPTSARLILLGDKDQLASVEAGAVLADICSGGTNRFSPVSRQACKRYALERLPALSDSGSPLGDCIVQLQKNYRFAAADSIPTFSRAINAGDAGGALGLLSTPPPDPTAGGAGVFGHPLPPPAQLQEALRGPVRAAFSELSRAADAAGALQTLRQFRILCALREGPFGVSHINRLGERILLEEGLIRRRQPWYRGRPIMITRNDYDLKLFNGDVGVLWPDPHTGEPRAWFAGPGDRPRPVLPIRLPEHETVFAMTVHKSQGSEFDRVLLVLPDRDTPVLNRELIYTAVTRAARAVDVWYVEGVLRMGLARRVQRASGLREALWGPAPARSLTSAG